MKYNPGFLTDEELVASFCVRVHEFESIIEMLRECDGSSNPHRLVIGPRGCGKTSLLLRVAAEIHRNPELSRSFFPIVFAEESYEVATAGEFWLEALSRLASQAPHLEGEHDLRLTFEELRTTADDQMLSKRCLGSLLDFSKQHGKRLILIVENLNMMFRDMADPEAGWRLRQTLQTEPRIILLASATTRFDEIDNPERAFYDLFVSRALRPLSAEECATLWESVSGQHRLPETMRGLRILTGGSPRLLSIVARFGSNLLFHKLMEDLLELIDDLTEYFKSHIEALSAQERRVYLALADLWEPATAREVATQIRSDASKCSAQLNRLVERGVVEVVGGGARRKLYYLTERLYNIYYLLRRSRTPSPLIEALIRFMDQYYSPPQLKDISFRMIHEADGLEPEVRTLHWAAVAKLIALPRLAPYRQDLLSGVPEEYAKNFLGASPGSEANVILAELEPANLRAAEHIPPCTTAREQGILAKTSTEKDSVVTGESQTKDMATVIHSILKQLEADDSPLARAEAAKTIINEGLAFIKMGQRLEEAIVAYEEVVRQFGDSEVPQLVEQVSRAMYLKGLTLGELNQPDDELATYEEIVRRFGDSKVATVLQVVAHALINKGVTLGKMNRTDGEIAAYDEVVHRLSNSKVPEILEAVARALISKAFVLGRLNQFEEAVAVCNEVIRRFGDDDISQVLEQTATAFFLKGTMLSQINRPAEAIDSYDEVVHRFGNSDIPEICAQVALALNNKGAVFSQLSRLDEELATYDEVLRRFNDSTEPGVCAQVAHALVNKGVVLGSLDRLDEEISIYDEVVRQYGDSGVPLVIEQVAKSVFFKGNTLHKLDQSTEAIAAYDEVAHRFIDSDMPEILEVISLALFNKGSLLYELNRLEDAIAVCDEIVQRFSNSDMPVILETVAHALSNKGGVFHKLGRLEEAAVACDEVVQRFGDSDMPRILETVAHALFNKGGVFYKLNRLEEAVVACDELLQQFGDSDVPVILEMIALALFNKGSILHDLNRLEDAIAVYDETIQRFGDSDMSEILEVVAQALVNKGNVFIDLDRPKEAIASYDEVVQRFENSDVRALRVWVARSLICKGTSLNKPHQAQQAKMVWKELIQRFGEIEDPAFHHFTAIALLQLADSARKQGDFGEAINAANLALKRPDEKSYHHRCKGYLIRSQAYMAAGDSFQAEQDIKAALALLPDSELSLGDTINVLLKLTVAQGAAHINDLIQASPSAKLLVPLTVALDKELGKEPRVAREIEEVAEDVRKDLEKLRKVMAYKDTQPKAL